MQFSIAYELTNPKPWDDRSEHRVWQEAIRQVELADRLGFYGVWAVEHHFLEELSACSAPEIFLTACAARTENIRIGHGVVLLPQQFNNPIRIAERVAALDIVSNGRVEFGTGRASSLIELDGFGCPPEETRARWEESLEIIPQMWMKDRFSYEGKYFSMPERNVLPKPIQKPHPPIWMACTQESSFEIAARKGIGVLCFTSEEPEAVEGRVQLYRRLVKDAKPVGAFVNDKICGFTPMYTGESQQEAVEVGGYGAAWYQTTFLSKIYQGWEDRPVEGYERQRRSALTAQGREWDLQRYTKRGLNVGGWAVGDADAVATVVQRYIDQGFDHLMFIVQTGHIPHDKILASLERFAKEVMPRFQGAGAARS